MIELAFIVALVVLFIHMTTREGMVNEWFANSMFDAPEWIKKPVYDCPICMAPYWGALILLIGYWTGTTYVSGIFEAILILFAAGGINAVLIYIISYDKAGTKQLEENGAE